MLGSRQSTKYKGLAKHNTLQYDLKSIRSLGAKLWNEIPVTIRSSSTKFCLKSMQKLTF